MYVFFVVIFFLCSCVPLYFAKACPVSSLTPQNSLTQTCKKTRRHSSLCAPLFAFDVLSVCFDSYKIRPPRLFFPFSIQNTSTNTTTQQATNNSRHENHHSVDSPCSHRLGASIIPLHLHPSRRINHLVLQLPSHGEESTLRQIQQRHLRRTPHHAFR